MKQCMIKKFKQTNYGYQINNKEDHTFWMMNNNSFMKQIKILKNIFSHEQCFKLRTQHCK